MPSWQSTFEGAPADSIVLDKDSSENLDPWRAGHVHSAEE
jgi:hypothetical protein